MSLGIRKIQPTLSLDPTGSVFWVIGLSLSSLPQHFSTTQMGKGGFAVSFYVLLLKRNKLRQPKCQLFAGFASCCVSRACSWCNGI